MFNFGDPLDTAKLIWARSMSTTGPAIPEVPYDELEERELRSVFTYLYMSVEEAIGEGVEGEVMQILVNEYDVVFELLAEACDSFREAVRANRHVPVVGYSPENVKKYKRLAGVLPSES